ncbi:hypothetical protein [Pontibacter sp. G13]|uniref:hypothetical protein n=1 Tax=Pontibacter sp. G13 TaxID=3074898 RepID=UPI00288BEBEE|nr:hypothetical protein [Pontibacter sp. G13]WNJ17896.1 hypothetical protein RJD25_23835 [Pontibacter sp. G13]
MKPFTTYGLKCSKKDEKNLVFRINEYLASKSRTMSKAKNKSMLDSRLPFVFKHFYWNLNKGVGTWFELFPNEDIEGKYFNETHKDCGWILKTRLDLTHPLYEKNKTEKFLSDVLDSTEFEYIILEESDEDEE